MMSGPVPVGVIEGFYGQPWSHEERLSCIDTIADWDWNTYVWAAKAEPRHRDAWVDPFTDEELDQFAELAGRDPRVKLMVGLTPGSEASAASVIDKLRPAIHAGAGGIVLCFDDLPVLDSAAQHRQIANDVLETLGGSVWIVPTHYAGTSSSPYLEHLCEGLATDIQIMWTGNMVVNDSIHAEEAVARSEVTGGRSPLVWDNAPVNDALMTSHLHLGPFTGRDPGVRQVCSGWLWNPMISKTASMVMLESAAAWWRGDDPIQAWETAVDRDGWRALAEATAYRGEHHWPGETPAREWWEHVRDAPYEDASLFPWVASARLGATLALAALDVLDAAEADLTLEMVSKATRSLMPWTAYRTQSALTFGAGPRRRPLATQDSRGRFTLSPASVSESVSLVDELVSRALSKLTR